MPHAGKVIASIAIVIFVLVASVLIKELTRGQTMGLLALFALGGYFAIKNIFKKKQADESQGPKLQK